MTRAAMIVLRLVPQALEAFLGIARRRLHNGGNLPRGGLDGPIRHGSPTAIGTQRARIPRASSDDDEEPVPLLLSVFLTPDDDVVFESHDVRERDWGQRLDGVIAFPDLVIAIESKVEEGAPTAQSEHVKLEGLQADERRIVRVGWQELFAELLDLTESGLLGLAERALIHDLLEFAEREPRFDQLLPFRTLAACTHGNGTFSDYRVRRRLRTILEDASGVRSDLEFGHGWNILISGGRTLSQAGLVRHNDQLRLEVWPGQRAHESRAFLEDRERLARLAARPGDGSQPSWYVWLLPQVGYFRHHVDLTPADPENLALYVANAEELRARVGRMHQTDFKALQAWLLELGLASEQDEEHFSWAMSARALPTFRAGCCVGRAWPWERAVALDENDSLVLEVQDALNELMDALGEQARF